MAILVALAVATPDGSSSARADDDFIGELIGDRYRIEKQLGRGGMGAVYRAEHVSLSRPVAVKVLHQHLTDDDDVSKRFEREALAASKLDHVNCVQVIDFGTTDQGTKYLVMPFLEGEELRDHVGKPMEVQRAVDLGAQILRALEHAHRRSMVHRDLKPENVFLVRDDEGEEVVKLVDFGIVKLLDDGSGAQEKLTRVGLIFGTPRYMSPEQAAGGKIDERTDLYAVGVLLYEMLAGKPPFDAEEPTIVLRMHMISDPPALPEHVPEPLRAFVARLLEKMPADRFQTAKEARKALEKSLDGVGPIATPPEALGSAATAVGSPAAVLDARDPAAPQPAAPAPPPPAAPAPPPAAASPPAPTAEPPPVAMPPPGASTSRGSTMVVGDAADITSGVTGSGAGVPIDPLTGLPPSGTFKTIRAVEAPLGPEAIPRRRDRNWIVIGLVLAAAGLWLVYMLLTMRSCAGAGTSAPADAHDSAGAPGVGGTAGELAPGDGEADIELEKQRLELEKKRLEQLEKQREHEREEKKHERETKKREREAEKHRRAKGWVPPGLRQKDEDD